MKLLFIEDNKEIRDNLRIYLESVFDEILESDNGAQGLIDYHDKKPDIVLLDINLPLLNGIDVARKIREIDHITPIIILSAHDDRDTLYSLINLKLTQFLIKPVSRTEFKEVIERTINNIKNRYCNLNNILLEDGYMWTRHLQELSHDNQQIRLSYREICLFTTYCSFANPVFTNEDIHELIYNNEEYSENKIRMLLKRLRAKTNNSIIKNIYGVGYKFSIKREC